MFSFIVIVTFFIALNLEEELIGEKLVENTGYKLGPHQD